jgi:hypothetical protein
MPPGLYSLNFWWNPDDFRDEIIKFDDLRLNFFIVLDLDSENDSD